MLLSIFTSPVPLDTSTLDKEVAMHTITPGTEVSKHNYLPCLPYLPTRQWSYLSHLPPLYCYSFPPDGDVVRTRLLSHIATHFTTDRSCYTHLPPLYYYTLSHLTEKSPAVLFCSSLHSERNKKYIGNWSYLQKYLVNKVTRSQLVPYCFS